MQTVSEEVAGVTDRKQPLKYTAFAKDKACHVGCHIVKNELF